MLLNKEYKVSSNFWSLFANPLGNSLACGWAQLAFPSLLLHPTSFVPILRATISRDVSQLPGISSSKGCICSSQGSVPGYLSPTLLQAAQSSLFQLTRNSGPAHTSKSSPRARQHIPWPVCVTVSISIHSFPVWGYRGKNKPHVLQGSGENSKNPSHF